MVFTILGRSSMLFLLRREAVLYRTEFFDNNLLPMNSNTFAARWGSKYKPFSPAQYKQVQGI
jgi:hypothetical protein